MRIFIIIYIEVIAKNETKQNQDTGVSLQQSNAVKIKRKVKRCLTWLSKVSCHGKNRRKTPDIKTST